MLVKFHTIRKGAASFWGTVTPYRAIPSSTTHMPLRMCGSLSKALFTSSASPCASFMPKLSNLPRSDDRNLRVIGQLMVSPAYMLSAQYSAGSSLPFILYFLRRLFRKACEIGLSRISLNERRALVNSPPSDGSSDMQLHPYLT